MADAQNAPHDPKVRVHQTMHDLKAGSPVHFRAFVEALQAYVARATSDLVRSPPDKLQVLQGRAQQADEILQMALVCTEKSRQYLEELNGRRTATRT